MCERVWGVCGGGDGGGGVDGGGWVGGGGADLVHSLAAGQSRLTYIRLVGFFLSLHTCVSLL